MINLDRPRRWRPGVALLPAAEALLRRGMRKDLRLETAKPRQSFAGIIEADEKRVWDALLEISPHLTPRMREMIAGSQGVLSFPARPVDGQPETPPVPGINVEIGNDPHRLAISGQWWFRGVYSTVPQESETLLRYQVFNVASRATRWLVPLVAGRALRASARPQFEQTLATIGSQLGCPARPVSESSGYGGWSGKRERSRS